LLPLRGPQSEDEDEISDRDAMAEELAQWLMQTWTEVERNFFLAIEWVNCHEHVRLWF
jgi:hypothetical protein